MSIWGDQDANDIPDDPFKITPNWYKAISTECHEKVVDEDEGVSQLIIKWKIQAPGTEFHNLPITDRKTYFKPPRDMNGSDWVPDGEQRRANSFLKLLLRTGFDLTPDEINKFEPRMGLNRVAVVEVTNNPDKTNDQIIYNNVRTVMSERLYVERHGSLPGGEDVSSGYNASTMLDEM